ncbi:MAG: hypothetical protein WDZ51_18575 [Pirellulaceae bacterium]
MKPTRADFDYVPVLGGGDSARFLRSDLERTEAQSPESALELRISRLWELHPAIREDLPELVEIFASDEATQQAILATLQQRLGLTS